MREVMCEGRCSMMDGILVSELKNYSEALGCCDKGSVVYLTKNGQKKYVIQSLLEYDKLQATIKLLAELSKGVGSGSSEGCLTIDEAFGGLAD